MIESNKTMENQKKEKQMDEMIPYGSAYINGYRVVFNPYFFKWGKDKGKVRCWYRKGKGYKKIVLNPKDIKILKE